MKPGPPLQNSALGGQTVRGCGRSHGSRKGSTGFTQHAHASSSLSESNNLSTLALIGSQYLELDPWCLRKRLALAGRLAVSVVFEAERPPRLGRCGSRGKLWGA